MVALILLASTVLYQTAIMSAIPKRPPGPSSKHINRILQLRKHLKELPAHLPDHPPESRYVFNLDPDILDDAGTFAALTRSLKVAFIDYSQGPATASRIVEFSERGTRLTNDLIEFLKIAYKSLSENE